MCTAVSSWTVFTTHGGKALESEHSRVLLQQRQNTRVLEMEMMVKINNWVKHKIVYNLLEILRLMKVINQIHPKQTALTILLLLHLKSLSGPCSQNAYSQKFTGLLWI